ncbi:MAG: hypothetical protein WCK02_04790 [Bacteroidota bacterium]
MEIHIKSSKSILNLYFKLYSYSNTPEQWSKPHFSYNEFLLLSFEKFKVLSKAFDIGKCNDIQNGKFITKRKIADYDILLSKINSDLKEKQWFEVDKLDFTKENIIRLFQKLWQYRIELTKVVNFAGIQHETNPINTYSSLKIGIVNKAIQNEIKVIDEILCMIISPKNKTFTLDELVKNHNYPNKELDEWDYLF